MAAAVLSRATPAASLNSSQAQTSAAVFEYRCMFTHDVRKKAKKWHDGYLRFHTFNKRVMVYDETKNLVGSLHYRSPEEFAEGLELSLDSHILVQVEERLGETSTDLTPLLGRHQQDGTSQSVRPDPPTRATLSRINAANTQIKPKSIKELLAGSQGQIGRARFPTQSPYDRQHLLVESHPTCPDPKRRKVDHGKENDIENLRSAGKVARNTSERTSIAPRQENVVVHISSEEDSCPPPPARPKKPRVQPTSSRPKETSSQIPTVSETGTRKTNVLVSADDSSRRSDVHNDSGSSSPSSPRRNRGTTNTKTKTKTKTKLKASTKTVENRPSRSSPTPSPTSKTPLTETQTPVIRHSSGPRSSLKFAAEKPRPKLMYRALLEKSSKPASSTDGARAIQGSTSFVSLNEDQDETRTTRRPKLTNLIEVDRMFAPSQIDREVNVSAWGAVDNAVAVRPPRTNDSVASQDPRTTLDVTQDREIFSALDEDITETIPDSPLFLPRTNSQISPSQSRNVEDHDSDFPSLSQALQHTTPKNSKDLVGGQADSPLNTKSPSKSLPDPTSSPVFHWRSLVHEEADHEFGEQRSESRDNDLDPARSRSIEVNKLSLPAPPRAPPTQMRLFRRVVSENVPPRPTSPDTTASGKGSPCEDAMSNLADDSLLQDISPRSKILPTQPQSLSDPVDIRLKSPSPPFSSSSSVHKNGEPQSMDDIPSMPPQLPEIPNDASISIEESGPWTPTEAFLLFDRWPPGRQKPPYATVTPPDLNTSTHRDNRGGGRHQQGLFPNAMSTKKYGTFGSAKFVSQR